MKNQKETLIGDLTRQEVIEEIEIEDNIFGQTNVGYVPAAETLSDPNHCFGRDYLPVNDCEQECSVRCMFRGQVVRLNRLCRELCSGTTEVKDKAALYYRYGSGSYYTVKALLHLREANLQQIISKALQFAAIDGCEDIDMSDRVYRTLTTLKSDGKVRKSGRGQQAVYMLNE